MPEVGFQVEESKRIERVRWLQAAACVALTYATLGSARGVVDLLRERNLLRITVLAVFLAVGLAIAVRIIRRSPGRREIAVLAAAAAVYVIVLLPLERAEERLHFLQYGLIAGLIYLALEQRWVRSGRAGEWVAGVVAAFAGLAIGWLDEGIQHLLPNRIYDLRDVFFNFAGGALAVGVAVALGRARGVRRSG